MNIVALRTTSMTEDLLPLVGGGVARVEVFDDLAGAEPHWRALERAQVLATPYQRFEFLNLWQRHVGAEAGFTPFIVVAFDSFGAPLWLLPFGARRLGPWTVAEFLGGKHANFNMGLWRRDIAASIDAETLRTALRRLSGRADLLMLRNQPLNWGGLTNPLALLPHQRAANFGYSGKLMPDFDALLCARTSGATRKKMRRKERALAAYGPVRFERADTVAQVRRVLDVFFKQKHARMHKLGVCDAFAESDVHRFIEAAAAAHLADGSPLIELYSLSVGETVVATMAGMTRDGRFCGMFNSMVDGAYAAESPGEQILVNLVRHCGQRGLDTFDLGIGDASYKHMFCDDAEPLFDSFLPLSPAGRFLAPVASLEETMKRCIKQHAVLWSTVRAVRRLRGRLAG